jgi:hypothetical protein
MSAGLRPAARSDDFRLSCPGMERCGPLPCATKCEEFMTAETLVRMLEEMIDLKLHQYAQVNLKMSPEVARVLQEKRETDRRRLDQIRRELVRILES